MSANIVALLLSSQHIFKVYTTHCKQPNKHEQIGTKGLKSNHNAIKVVENNKIDTVSITIYNNNNNNKLYNKQQQQRLVPGKNRNNGVWESLVYLSEMIVYLLNTLIKL